MCKGGRNKLETDDMTAESVRQVANHIFFFSGEGAREFFSEGTKNKLRAAAAPRTDPRGYMALHAWNW